MPNEICLDALEFSEKAGGCVPLVGLRFLIVSIGTEKPIGGSSSPGVQLARSTTVDYLRYIWPRQPSTDGS